MPTGDGPLRPPMRTLQILGGRKEKIRPGDVLGALTKDMGFAAAQIGKINVNEFSTYVAIAAEVAAAAERKLKELRSGVGQFSADPRRPVQQPSNALLEFVSSYKKRYNLPVRPQFQ